MSTDRNYGPSATPAAPNTLALNQQAQPKPVLAAHQVITTAVETVIQNPAISTPAAPQPLLVTIPCDSALEQKHFDLVISGYVTIGAASVATLNFYSGSDITLANDHTFNAPGASLAALAVGSYPFMGKASLIFSSVSGTLIGSVRWNIGGSYVADQAISIITGFNIANNPVGSFLATATFSVANAGNAINVQEFAINF